VCAILAIHLFAYKKGSPVHVVPVCAKSGEGSDHFGSYVRSFSLHFCKRLFLGLEPMTSSFAYDVHMCDCIKFTFKS
jgi:hypothetical protein